MMTPRFRMTCRVLGGLVLAAPLATRVAAQTSPAAAATQAPTARSTNRSAMIEKRITDLHTRLKITPMEQKPFDDFAQVMRDNAQHMEGLVQKRQPTFASGNAVEQMQGYSEMAQAHAEDVQRLTTAFAALYEVLSPDQKKAADQSFRQFANNRRGAAG